VAEQKEAGGGGFAAEVGSLFELWNAPDGREWVGAEEMARQFQQAEDLLDGLKYTAERAVGYGAYIVLGDAKRLAARVREVRAEAVSRQGNRRTNVLIEITRKLVAADASIDCCAICGNDFNLGSVYAVATADRSEEIRLMCPTRLEYLNRRKEDAEGPN